MLGIIAVLASILVPTLVKYVGDTRIMKAQKDVELICAAIGKFYSDTSLMPVSSDYINGTKNDVDVLKGPGNNPTDYSGTDADKWLDKVLDDMDNHLMDNEANYPTTGGKKWNGPYLSQLSDDPWGNCYLVNVRWIQPSQISHSQSCFVLSSGPNGEIDTEFNGNNISPAGDDIVCRLK